MESLWMTQEMPVRDWRIKDSSPRPLPENRVDMKYYRKTLNI
ncbi:hypothetical protein RSSM_04555 [Rhodopirellula sallentina SM41]|uniref:Uncharacterized protein n=1 Tax=Rhodopirellula sallentina SM41 TaxID=1263870 RepID=M5TXR0_9BACT|nr:hypothetical protein RSSM_04555 [Rhodopirellula sallentina SM41]